MPSIVVNLSLAGAVAEWHSQLIEPEVVGVPENGKAEPVTGNNTIVDKDRYVEILLAGLPH